MLVKDDGNDSFQMRYVANISCLYHPSPTEVSKIYQRQKSYDRFAIGFTREIIPLVTIIGRFSLVNLWHRRGQLDWNPSLPFKSWNELFGVKPVGWTGVAPTLDKSIVKTELFRSPFPNFPRIWSTSVIKSSMRSIALFFSFSKSKIHLFRLSKVKL